MRRKAQSPADQSSFAVPLAAEEPEVAAAFQKLDGNFDSVSGQDMRTSGVYARVDNGAQRANHG
jgi:hypothetical protein